MFRSSISLITAVVLAFSGAVLADDAADDNSPLGGLPASGSAMVPTVGARGDVLDFPTSADTWEVASYPYWWHVGDRVYGTYVTTSDVDHADIHLALTNNVLSGSGHCDLELRIDGITVGTFSATAATGLGPIVESFDFSLIPAGTHEISYYQTNQVGSGLGSISLSEVSGTNSVTLSGPVSLDWTTWGGIKAAI